jgi:hypothetical protein
MCREVRNRLLVNQVAESPQKEIVRLKYVVSG